MTTQAAHEPEHDERPASRREVLVRQGRLLIRAIQENDEAAIESAVIALSRSRRIFAPLVFAVGAFVMLFQALRLLFSNWRLTLVQVLPAMWIWAALLDLKAHTFHGKEFHKSSICRDFMLYPASGKVAGRTFRPARLHFHRPRKPTAMDRIRCTASTTAVRSGPIRFDRA